MPWHFIILEFQISICIQILFCETGWFYLEYKIIIIPRSLKAQVRPCYYENCIKYLFWWQKENFPRSVFSGNMFNHGMLGILDHSNIAVPENVPPTAWLLTSSQHFVINPVVVVLSNFNIFVCLFILCIEVRNLENWRATIKYWPCLGSWLPFLSVWKAHCLQRHGELFVLYDH